MKRNDNHSAELLAQTREKITKSLSKNGIVILPPMDVFLSARLIELLGIKVQTTIFDPWYNKGVGGEREDYVDYILRILEALKAFSEHLFFWGFPQIVAHFVDKIPEPLQLKCWLTWFYKNSPSMIRGWRSAQMTCLHLARPDAKMHVENFLNEVQLQKFKQGKLRFIPGPPSVIEESLLCGFVGRKEQTGHPSQKPIAVIEKLVLMGTGRGDLVVDLMSGSGTSAEAAYNNERFSIICDISEDYTQIAEKRLGVKRINLPARLINRIDAATSALRPKKIRIPFKNDRPLQKTDPTKGQQLSLLMGS
ncbi:MAG: site-specific DNA-methyltransferase [Deltaproteobacteria bacterium]|nr:site-specific DNA-methyltransferase [Deltaproteobacteria bacterium]MBW2169722.1 site-specific DNA-methyltransferase [Deltaproteobacteria bacterium]